MTVEIITTVEWSARLGVVWASTAHEAEAAARIIVNLAQTDCGGVLLNVTGVGLEGASATIRGFLGTTRGSHLYPDQPVDLVGAFEAAAVHVQARIRSWEEFSSFEAARDREPAEVAH